MNLNVKAGITCAVVYVAVVLFFVFLLLVFKEGFWAFIPLGLITYFPIYALFEFIFLWLFGQLDSNDTAIEPMQVLIVKMVIGGLLNLTALFFLGFIIALVSQRLNNISDKKLR